MGRQASTVAIRIKIRTNIYFEETAMTIANVDDFGRDVRSAIRHHWVLFLIPGIVMAILGLLAAAAPFIATPVGETFAGWLFLTGGFVGLAALFTTRNVPGFVWTFAVLAILIGAFLVWRPFAGLVTLTVALAAFFAAHGIVQILTALNHRRFARSWRRLGARPAHRHQSLHVRPGAGDDRDCVPKRQRRVREDKKRLRNCN
jgi:uncharacterized membrane protein HdeD (DUF308 family)